VTKRNPIINALLLARLEGELDAASAYRSNLKGNDEDATAAAVKGVDAVVDHIAEIPLGTLGALRLQARALLAWYDGAFDDAPGLRELLEAAAQLPARLWDEPIGEEEKIQ
jgi:hypothetical protein